MWLYLFLLWCENSRFLSPGRLNEAPQRLRLLENTLMRSAAANVMNENGVFSLFSPHLICSCEVRQPQSINHETAACEFKRCPSVLVPLTCLLSPRSSPPGTRSTAWTAAWRRAASRTACRESPSRWSRCWWVNMSWNHRQHESSPTNVQFYLTGWEETRWNSSWKLLESCNTDVSIHAAFSWPSRDLHLSLCVSRLCINISTLIWPQG